MHFIASFVTVAFWINTFPTQQDREGITILRKRYIGDFGLNLLHWVDQDFLLFSCSILSWSNQRSSWRWEAASLFLDMHLIKAI